MNEPQNYFAATWDTDAIVHFVKDGKCLKAIVCNGESSDEFFNLIIFSPTGEMTRSLLIRHSASPVEGTWHFPAEHYYDLHTPRVLSYTASWMVGHTVDRQLLTDEPENPPPFHSEHIHLSPEGIKIVSEALKNSNASQFPVVNPVLQEASLDGVEGGKTFLKEVYENRDEQKLPADKKVDSLELLQAFLSTQDILAVASGDWPKLGYTIGLYDDKVHKEGLLTLKIPVLEVGFIFTEDGKFLGAFNWKE